MTEYHKMALAQSILRFHNEPGKIYDNVESLISTVEMNAESKGRIEERERCALIAETLIRPRAGDSVGAATGYEIASKIREG